MSRRLHAISRAGSKDLATQPLMNSSSPLYIRTSQSLKRSSFSWHLSCREKKFSWCAPPMLVRMPMVGLMMVSSAFISPGWEMPASRMASSSRSSIRQTERGTPICEL